MNVEEQLMTYFRNHADAEVRFDTPLVKHGVIDSMGVLELIAFIESTYDVTLDMDDLTIENFGTINDIKNLIKQKKGDSL